MLLFTRSKRQNKPTRSHHAIPNGSLWPFPFLLFRAFSFFSLITFCFGSDLQAASHKARSAHQTDHGTPCTSFNIYDIKKFDAPDLLNASFRCAPKATAAFHGKLGLEIRGKLKAGSRKTFIVPLDPSQTIKFDTPLGHHGAQVFVRSSDKALLRYIVKGLDDRLFISHPIRINRSKKEDMKVTASEFVRERSFENLWSTVIFNGTDTEESYEGYKHNGAIKGPFTPYAIEFEMIGSGKEQIIYLDEFQILQGCQRPEIQKQWELTPLYSQWPNPDQSPFPHGMFNGNYGWNAIAHKNNPQAIELTTEMKSNRLYLKAICPEQQKKGQKSLSSASIDIRPTSNYIHIGKKQGVVGLRLQLRSSGIAGSSLKLYLRDEVLIQKDNKTSRLEESFITSIPLNFDGKKTFNLPLNRIAFPIGSHAKSQHLMTQGNLILDKLAWNFDPSEKRDPKAEHQLVIEAIEQFVDLDAWQKAHPSLSHEAPDKLKLDDDISGTVIYPMNVNPFKFDSKNSLFTAEPTFTINETLPIFGPQSLSIEIPPSLEAAAHANDDDKANSKRSRKKSKRQTRTIAMMVNSNLHTLTRSGMGPHEMACYLQSSHKGTVRTILSVAGGRKCYSDDSTFKATKMRRSPKDSADMLKASQWITLGSYPDNLKYLYERDARGQYKKFDEFQFPLKPVGYLFTFPNIPEGDTIKMELDEFTVWEGFAMKSQLDDHKRVAPTIQHKDFEMPFLNFSSSSGLRLIPKPTHPVYRSKESELKAKKTYKEKSDIAKKAYAEAEKKMKAAKAKDPKKRVSVSQFFNSKLYVDPDAYEAPSIHQLYHGEDQLAFKVKWTEGPKRAPWQRDKYQYIDFAHSFWKHKNSKVLIDDSTSAIVLPIYSSGHASASLRIDFFTSKKENLRFTIPLDFKGQKNVLLPLKKSTPADDKKANKDRSKNQGAKSLHLRTFMVMNTGSNKQFGEHELRFYPAELLVAK